VGNLLALAFPATALAVGVLLYLRSPAGVYLGFTWWLWFLTPGVRRLIDYQYGWNPENPVMLAPYLVTALVGFTALRHLPKLRLLGFFPFGLIAAGVGYGYIVGVHEVGPGPATYDLLNWLLPVLFAFHLVVYWRYYPRARRAILQTFVWGVLVMGAYGIWQYLDPPEWDQYWMLNAPMDSIGAPEPREVRVFSTLNSPGPFAGVIMAGLLLLLGGGGPLRWPSAVVGYVSLLLSLVRSAWGGWLVGLPFILLNSGRVRLRLLVPLIVMVLIALPLITSGPIYNTIDERLQTTTALEQDQSFSDRLRFYAEFGPQAFLNPSGAGLGSTGVSTKLETADSSMGALGNFDSGVMNIGFVLGWPGSLLYVSGVAWLLFYAFRKSGELDLFAAACRGIVAATLVQLIFSNSLVGISGMVVWTFLGLLLAARAYDSAPGKSDDQRDVSGAPPSSPGSVLRPEWTGRHA
jgi:hypothetical protein